MSKKFKVGDKVRAVTDLSPIRIGDVGIIRNNRSAGYYVDFPARSDTIMYASELELVTEPEWKPVTVTAIKKGERVRATSIKHPDNFAEFTVDNANACQVTSAENMFGARHFTFERLESPVDPEKEKLRKQLSDAQAKVAELAKVLEDK